MIVGSSVGAVALVLAIAALLAGASRVGRTLALVLGTLGLVIPFVVPDAAPAHFLAALAAAVGLARIADLARDRVPRRPLARVWQAFAAFDTRTTTLGTPTFAWRWVMTGALFAALSVASVIGIELSSRAHVIRLACGVVLTYSVMDTINHLVRAGYAAGGLHVPPMQQSPVLARTLAEFWGARWNLVVSSWLRREVFLPVARRIGAAGGLAAAFVVSALLHAYLTAPAVGLAMAAMMAGFFLAQGVLVFLERLLRVARWPAPLAHAWVVVTLLGTSPLFVEPVLRVLF